VKLERNGIITDYGAHVNLQALGYNIKAFINLEVDPKQKPVFYPFVEGIPNVLECNCVTGEFSMLLKVAFPTTKELDTFIGELQQFGKTYTQIVFSTSVGPRGIHFEDQ
jgi:Lrp/AsnC family leucine-responsive transcriptional regulator